MRTLLTNPIASIVLAWMCPVMLPASAASPQAASTVTFTPISADSTVNASIIGSLANYNETESSTALEPNLQLQNSVASGNISVLSAVTGANNPGSVPPNVVVSVGYNAKTSGSTNDADISYSYELTFSLDRPSLVSLVNGNSGAAYPRATASGVSSASLTYTLRHQAGAGVFVYAAPTTNTSGTYAQAVVPAGIYVFTITGAASSPGDPCCVLQAGQTSGIVRLQFEDAPPTLFCTAKTNSQGCVPQVSFSGAPSATDPSPFNITASMLLNSSNGIMFYGYATQPAAPFLGGTLCVASPLRRTAIQNSGGTPPPAKDCSGTYTFDFNAQIQGGSDPLLVAGQEIAAQYWYRDPTHVDGTGAGVTDGIFFAIGD